MTTVCRHDARGDLWLDPDAVRLSRELHVSRAAAVGAIYYVSRWSGPLHGLTCDDLDAEVGLPGFARALMATRRWLREIDGVLHAGLVSRPSLFPDLDLAQEPEDETEAAIARLMQAWATLPSIVPRPKEWSATRRRALRSRLASPAWLDQAIEAIRRIPSIPFLCGENDRGWVVTIDTFLRPDTVTKILEGAYGRPKAASSGRVRDGATRKFRVWRADSVPPEAGGAEAHTA